MDVEAKKSLYCLKCNIEYTTMDLGDKCIQCGGELDSNYEYGRPLNGFLKEDHMEDKTGKCSKCGNAMEKWREEKGYTCLDCWRKDNPKTDKGGSFSPQTTNKPSRSVEELATLMETCMLAAKNLLNSVDKTVDWTSEDIRATGNTLFIQKNKE